MVIRRVFMILGFIAGMFSRGAEYESVLSMAYGIIDENTH